MADVITDFQRGIDKMTGEIARATETNQVLARQLFSQLCADREMWQRQVEGKGTVVKEGSIARGYTTLADTGSTRNLAKLRVEIIDVAIHQLKPLMKNVK